MFNLKSHNIFFAIAAIGIITLSLFTYLSVNALQSSTDPKSNSFSFYQFHELLTKGNFILFVVLLITSNIMYIRQKFWDPFIWTALIFITFTVIDWFWLSEMIFHYKKHNNLWQGETNLGYIIGFVFAFLAFVVVIINFLILKIFTKENKNNISSINTEKNNEIRANK